MQLQYHVLKRDIRDLSFHGPPSQASMICMDILLTASTGITLGRTHACWGCKGVQLRLVGINRDALQLIGMPSGQLKNARLGQMLASICCQWGACKQGKEQQILLPQAPSKGWSWAQLPVAALPKHLQVL